MSEFRKKIQNEILDVARDKGIDLTQEELRSAVAGVRYAMYECLADSVQDALSTVQYDREHDTDK